MTLICLIFTTILVTTLMGILQIQRDWSRAVLIQNDLDRCLGSQALKFVQTMNELQKRNREIKIIRAALIPATLKPAIREALHLALKLEVTRQEQLRIQWKILQGRWLAGLSCRKFSDLGPPLLGLPVIRDPPDLLGPRPLRFVEKIKNGFKKLWMARRNRRSVIEVLKNKNEKWVAQWSSLLKTKMPKPAWRLFYGSP